MGGRRKGGQRQRQFEAILKGETPALNDETEAREPDATDDQQASLGEHAETYTTLSGSPAIEGGLSGLRLETAPCASGEYEQAQNSCEKGTSSAQ